MKPTVSIRLTLHTEMGIVGQRLVRGEALPNVPTDFPDTAQGRIEAEAAREKFQIYIDKHHK